jgi:NAD/NADP transhydrogenase beta subunit
MFEQLGANRDAIPAYEVVDGESDESAGISRQQATLIVQDATVESATAALADWASRADARYLQAVVLGGDDTYVCSLRAARDDAAAAALMRGSGPVELNCTEPVR